MTEVDFLNEFSKNLETALQDAKTTQAELAYLSGLSPSTISRYLNGMQMPTVKALVNIIDALECEPEDLVDFYERID